MIKFVAILTCAIVVCISGRVVAQNCGSASIDSATYMYSIGRFDECISTLNTCLNNKHGYSFDEKIQAYHLMAICYLAVDSISDAHKSIEALLSLKENFEPAFNDPERFIRELTVIKSRPKSITISSVSKKSEDVRLAPATAMVITQKEMLERGYTDLIDALKDIPGFDISVYYGQTYANIYQRGLRTDFTDRTLILVDGVEDNDLWSYFADISQQYPITNVKRIEIIYGPASTMYGPNAFSGVINIITKEPYEYIKNNRSFGVQANAGVATYNTKYLDASVAYKKGIFSMSITGRIYYSDRPNLSSQPWWNFDTSFFDTINYKKVLSIRENGPDYLQAHQMPEISNLYRLDGDEVILSDAGWKVAESYDKAAYDQPYHGHSIRTFENTAQSSYINAKLNIGELGLGFVSWEKQEGSGTTYTDRIASVIGTKWYPSHKYIYLSYNKPINQKLLFSTFINYRIHAIENGSRITDLYNYADRGLELADLFYKTPSYFATTYYYEQSEQFRSEFKFLYTRSENFYLIGGVELRNSQLQGYYLSSATSTPQENGTYSDSLPGGNTFNVNDIGVYAQGHYRTKNNFGFTVGGRLDYDQIRQDQGLGYTFSPRIVIDKLYKSWVYKIIFSTGVQNVSNFSKFNDVGTLVGNPNLKAESIYNYEVSASDKISNAFTADLDIYYSNVKNTVKIIRITQKTRQNINIGDFNIWGVQSNIYYSTQKLQASLNYSYCYGLESKDSFTVANGCDSLRVADIAANKVNAVVNYIFLNRYNINFRANYVGRKPAGPGTTARANAITMFPGYFLANIALSAHDVFQVKGIMVQLCCNNIFNKKYYSPGLAGAGGKNAAGSFLQMGINFSLRVGYEF